jgi:hypothetical protein
MLVPMVLHVLLPLQGASGGSSSWGSGWGSSSSSSSGYGSSYRSSTSSSTGSSSRPGGYSSPQEDFYGLVGGCVLLAGSTPCVPVVQGCHHCVTHAPCISVPLIRRLWLRCWHMLAVHAVHHHSAAAEVPAHVMHGTLMCTA